MHTVPSLEQSVIAGIMVNPSQYKAGSLMPQYFTTDLTRKICRFFEHCDNRSMDAVLPAMLGKGLITTDDVNIVSSWIDGYVPRNLEPSIAELRRQASLRQSGKALKQASVAIEQGSVELARECVAPLVNSPIDAAIDSPELSDDFLALEFTRTNPMMRYTAQWGRWHRWDGVRWVEDKTLDVFDRVRSCCRNAALMAQKPIGKVASGGTVTSVERLARSDRRHAATVDQWDRDAWLLATPGGVVNLKTGKLEPSDPTNYITKIIAMTPGGDCPLWMAFLDRITAGDRDLQAYLQRLVGYILTGSTREHALFFCWGTGANGKSTFVNVWTWLLGDYATTAPMSTFMATRNEQHPTDLAGLRSARLVTSIETQEGRAWAETRIKALTGGDPISARFMRQDFFVFTPTFKLVVAGNHKPRLSDVDEAFRRRLHLIPFVVTIPPGERDQDLPEKLKGEAGGILQWAIHGCLAWQKHGLDPPPAVVNATAQYLSEEDVVGQWIAERALLDRRAETKSKALYDDYKAWAEATGDQRPLTARTFSQRLLDRGCVQSRTNKNRALRGIMLASDSDEVGR